MSASLLARNISIDTLIFTGQGEYWGMRHRNATAALSVVYDGVDATGTMIDAFRAPTNSDAGRQFEHPVKVATGLFVDMTGSPSDTIWYKR